MKDIERKLAGEILDIIEDRGQHSFAVEADDNNVTYEIEGSYVYDGYSTVDNYDGHTSWHTTDASVMIENVRAFDEDGDEVYPDLIQMSLQSTLRMGYMQAYIR